MSEIKIDQKKKQYCTEDELRRIFKAINNLGVEKAMIEVYGEEKYNSWDLEYKTNVRVTCQYTEEIMVF